MIGEATIEATLQRLENQPDEIAAEIERLATEQPELINYLSNEDTEAFTEEEHDLLIFTALAIYLSVEAERGKPATTTGNRLAAAEEEAYELLSGKKGPFAERLDAVFARSREEELLALAEDMALSEEVTGEAREPFFVSLVAVIVGLTS